MITRFFKTLTAVLLTILLMIPFMPTSLADPGDEAVFTLKDSPELYTALMSEFPGKLDKAGNGITIGELEALTGTITLDGDYLSDIDHNGKPDRIDSIDGLDHCVQITGLELPDNKIVDLSPLENLKQLKKLDLSNNPDITDTSSIGALTNLESLNLRGDINITGLPTDSSTHDMSKFTHLYALSLGGYVPKNTAETKGAAMTIPNPILIAGLPKFKTYDASCPASLDISNSNITDASFLDTCEGLKYLFWRYQDTSSFTFPTCSNLNYVDLSYDSALVNGDVADIAAIKSLDDYNNTTGPTTLCISGTGITDVSDLSTAEGLGTLYWQDIPTLTATDAKTVGELSGLGHLKSLDLVNDTSLGDDADLAKEFLTTVNSLPNLTTLGIGNCGITDISSLENNTSISSLALGGNTGLTDITKLNTLTNLNYLALTNCAISDISSLLSLSKLNNVDFYGDYLDPTPGSQDMKDIAALKKSNPDITISGLDNQYKIEVDYKINSADAGKGILSKTSDEVYYGQKFTPASILSVDPDAFLGWDTNNDGTVDIYRGYPTALSVPLPCSAVTYTAVFNPAIYSTYLTNVLYSAGTLSPSAFTKKHYSYTLSLPEDVGSVTLSPIKEYDNSTLKTTLNGKTTTSDTYNVKNGKSITVKFKVSWNGSSHTYTFTIKRHKSTICTLDSLKAADYTTATELHFTQELDPSTTVTFDPDVTKYYLRLDEDTQKVKITAGKDTGISDSSLEKVYFDGSLKSSKTYSLSTGGSVTCKVKVVAQSGANKTYKIYITRAKSTDAFLKKLKTNLSSYQITGFKSDTYDYNLYLPDSISSVKLYATKENSYAKVEFNGTTTSSKKYTVANGYSKDAIITVYAQDRTITKTYTVHIFRAPDITSFSASPKVGSYAELSPGGGNSMKFTWKQAGAGHIVIEVAPTGTTSWISIHETDETASGTDSYPWDGTISGTPLAKGTYKARIRIASAAGSSAYNTLSFKIMDPPTVTLYTPSPVTIKQGGTQKTAVKVKWTIISNIKIGVYDSLDNLVATICDKTNQYANTKTWYWDGKYDTAHGGTAVPAGDYKIIVTAGPTSVTKTVTVTS